MQNPEPPRSPYLSEKEEARYFQRQEMLLEFSRLFDYSEASDRAVAIVGPAFLDTLLSDIRVLGSNGTENSLKDSGDLLCRLGRAPERS